jgi:8-oxo-dGTP diphosphatase
MAGFDTHYSNRADDDELAAISARETRILLTRDQGLLKRRIVTHGHWVRHTAPRRQFQEILDRFDLRRLVAPFTRCLRCNTPLRRVERATLEGRVPPRVLASHDDYHECPTCSRVYWKGTHHARMLDVLSASTAGLAPRASTGMYGAPAETTEECGRHILESMDWRTWRARDLATLVFVVRDGQVLLIRKKRGLGAGKINGPGGRLDPGETPAACAAREVREELRVDPIGLRAAGELRFQFADGYSIHVHVFRAHDLAGTPTETDEAVPLWTPLDEMPYEEMWADDRIWLPHLLAGRRFDGWFVFDGDRMLAHRVLTRGNVET